MCNQNIFSMTGAPEPAKPDHDGIGSVTQQMGAMSLHDRFRSAARGPAAPAGSPHEEEKTEDGGTLPTDVVLSDALLRDIESKFPTPDSAWPAWARDRERNNISNASLKLREFVHRTAQWLGVKQPVRVVTYSAFRWCRAEVMGLYDEKKAIRSHLIIVASDYNSLDFNTPTMRSGLLKLLLLVAQAYHAEHNKFFSAIQIFQYVVAKLLKDARIENNQKAEALLFKLLLQLLLSGSGLCEELLCALKSRIYLSADKVPLTPCFILQNSEDVVRYVCCYEQVCSDGEKEMREVVETAFKNFGSLLDRQEEEENFRERCAALGIGIMRRQGPNAFLLAMTRPLNSTDL